MSRHDPYKVPWLRPQAVRLWAKFRADHEEDWRKDHEQIVDGVTSTDGVFRRYAYRPESLFFQSNWFKSFRDGPKALDWEDEYADTPHGRQQVPTTRWEEGPFKVVVRQISYDLDNYSDYGKFTDQPDTEPYGKTWGTMFFSDPLLKKQLATALMKEFGYWSPPKGFEAAWDALKVELRKRVGANYPKQLHLRHLKGLDSRHAWRAGTYDTFLGKDSHPDRGRKYRYIQLNGYNYDELREWYWLMGRSKREADERARQEFRSRVAFMEQIAEGAVSDTFIQAEVYRIDDEDEEDALGSGSTSTVVNTHTRTVERYIDAIAYDAAGEALAEARKQVAKDKHTLILPGIQ